jgi:hypothetical protein
MLLGVFLEVNLKEVQTIDFLILHHGTTVPNSPWYQTHHGSKLTDCTKDPTSAHI